MENKNTKSEVSPFSKEVIFGEKLKQLFIEEKVEGCFVFYIPEKGDIHISDYGLCGHQLKKLSETIQEIAEQRLLEDPHEESTNY